MAVENIIGVFLSCRKLGKKRPLSCFVVLTSMFWWTSCLRTTIVGPILSANDQRKNKQDQCFGDTRNFPPQIHNCIYKGEKMKKKNSPRTLRITLERWRKDLVGTCAEPGSSSPSLSFPNMETSSMADFISDPFSISDLFLFISSHLPPNSLSFILANCNRLLQLF